jgi:predicted membrane-bound dolichyl-phosphate-mannose-protein mannosyltransferase
LPRRAWWLATGLLTAFTYLWRLGTATWHRDEYVYASAGRQYIAGHAGYNLEHPPLGKLLIGAGEAVFGHGPSGARVAAVTAAIATGLVLAAIARRVAGDRAALVTFALWVVLPKPTAGLRVDRLALLDVFAAGFAALAILLALRYEDRPGGRRALLVGVAIGLAGASKASGVLVAVPIAVYLVLRLRAYRDVALTAVAAAVAFVATYLPLDVSAWSAIRAMWDFQTREAQGGFPTMVDGHVYQHAPWWSAAWFAWHRSASLTVALAVLVAAAWLIRSGRGTLAILCGWAAIAALGVILGPGRYFEHYAYAWSPAVVLLASIGLVEIARRSRALAVLLAAPLAVAGAVSLSGIATARTADYALAGEQIAASGARSVLVGGTWTAFLGYACRDTRVVAARDGVAQPSFDAAITDPQVVGVELNRWPPAELRDHPERFRTLRADRLTVSIRRGIPPRPCLPGR